MAVAPKPPRGERLHGPRESRNWLAGALARRTPRAQSRAAPRLVDVKRGPREGARLGREEAKPRLRHSAAVRADSGNLGFSYESAKPESGIRRLPLRRSGGRAAPRRRRTRSRHQEASRSEE